MKMNRSNHWMVLKNVFSENMCVFIQFFLNKNKKIHLLCHFSEIPSVGLHPLGSIRCQRCREVDLEGHWVQLRAHLIGLKKNCNDLFFQDFFWKKTFLFNQFFHKETRFSQHFPCFFSHLEFHHVVDHPSRHVSKTVEPQPTEGSGPSPRAIVCGLTC